MTTTNQNIQNIIQNGMMNYSAYVLLQRAIPKLEDGLKPVHRRILYTMHRLKVNTFTKSNNITGSVMLLHPHGDTYGSVVGMVQKDRQLVPLVTGKGNFGMATSRELQPAASRYTEVKLSEMAKDMMRDFDKNVVDFIDNYDGTLKMPDTLPVKYPSILTYAQSGIGVGFSSSTASFNINEVVDNTVNYLQDGKQSILVPDFATGGYIINDEEVFKKINLEGSGSVQLRAKIDIEGNDLIVTEIPYTTTREAIIDKIVELAKAGKLNEVTDVKDLTGLKGMNIQISCKRNIDKEMLIEKLYRFTPLQSSHSSNMNILVDDLPKVIGVHEVIKKWTEWRINTVKRKITHEVKIMKEKLHLLNGLEKILLDIDKTIEIIRKSSEDEIENNLKANFNLDDIQAKEISNMKLRNINKDYILKKIEAINQFKLSIDKLEASLENEDEIKQIIINELKEVKEKFGVERRTKIIEKPKAKKIKIEQKSVPDYPVTIHLTNDGYIYKFKGDQSPHLKPGDEVKKVFRTTNDSTVLIFTKDNICYKLPLSTIDETRVTNIGHFIPVVINKPSIEIVNYSILDKSNKILIAAYRNNRFAKINLQSFNNSRKVLKNAYNKNQELVDLITLEDESLLKVKTSKTLIELDTNNLTLTNSRGATGVYVTRKGELKNVEIA